MLLQALYDFAKTTKTLHGVSLYDSPEFRSGYVAWLIQMSSSGEFLGLLPLWSPQEPGQLFEKLPRTVEAKDSGTVSEFLVEDIKTILGLSDSPSKPMKEKARRKHEHFWSRMADAASELSNPALKAILLGKDRITSAKTRINPVFELYKPPNSRSEPKNRWLAVTPTGEKTPLQFRPNTTIDATFSVDGELVVFDEKLLDWWTRWFENWLSDREEACRTSRGGGRICSVSGEIDAPISNSHLPKIKGKVIQSFGATLASAEADAVHSYGLSKQLTPVSGKTKEHDSSYSNVSVRSAISYCLALNFLLDSKEHHIDLGPISVCVWAKHSQNFGGQMLRSLGQAFPSEVAKFLKTPFSGNSEREIISRDRLYTVALTGNAGRVVIVHWLEQPVEKAVEHFRQWWDDLRIAPMFIETDSSNKKKSTKNESANLPPSPFAIPNLARATLRESKKQNTDKLVGERIVQLYRAALEGTAPSLMLLKPILDEFHSALVRDDAKKPTFPFSQSRFALIKLVLLRFFRSQPNRKEGDLMPEPRLADTPDPAYNLGRLLAVFESLQDRYHNFDKKGAGVVERYYGTASSAPAAVFPLLCRLARHHLSKVRKEEESAARRFDDQIGNILKQFQPDPAKPGSSPHFKRMLTLPEQGVFALGFYQQRAYDRAAASVLSNLAKARELRKADKPFAELLTKARDLANEFAYADLIIAVEDFDSQQ